MYNDGLSYSLGNFEFHNHEGTLCAWAKGSYKEYQYHPVDFESDVIDALDYFKSQGLHIKLSIEEMQKLFELTVKGDMFHAKLNRLDYITDYSKFRYRVKKRDDFRCVVCGSKSNTVVHHLNGFKKYPDMAIDDNNGVTLCKSCHDKYHDEYGFEDINAADFMRFMKKHS